MKVLNHQGIDVMAHWQELQSLSGMHDWSVILHIGHLVVKLSWLSDKRRVCRKLSPCLQGIQTTPLLVSIVNLFAWP